MKIRTWANLSLVGVVIIMTVLVLWTWQTQVRTVEARQALQMLDNLSANINNLDNLADEYRQNPIERPKQQWLKLHSEVLVDLESLATYSDNPMLPIIKSDILLVRNMFNDMIKWNLDNEAINQMAEKQLSQRLQTLIRHLATWRMEVRKSQAFFESLLVRLSIANVTCWSLFILLNSYLLRHRVIHPVTRLQKSARIIGSGHLEHRTGLESHDELGDLSRSIDNMSQQLQLITTSRDRLEREIQHRLQVEADLEREHKHLQELVKNSEAANHAKSVFLASMSHELRTPLNAILGFSELMAQDISLNEKQKETLAIINRSGAHLLSMINDVLDISKIEAGRLELTIQAFDLFKLLQEISDMIKVRAANKRLNFSLEIAAVVPQYIKCDSGKLRQILINLLGNAIKFTSEGYIILRAYALPLPAEARIMLEIEVLDSGTGIPADKIDQLFKPFVQLARQDSGLEGTGLGLAISQSLIKLMNGEISVSSVLGSGSTFTIKLPVVIAAADEITMQTQYFPVKSLEPAQPAWRLLVVDDNAENRLLLETMLTQVGFQVETANNGQEAIEKFAHWHPALCWMDMRMPVMDGYEATARIRQMEGGAEVKIIAVSASVFKDQHDSMIKAGCDAVIHKPFQAQEVFTTLINYLGVKFVYQDSLASSSDSKAEITTEMLSSLPEELRQKLHDAALHLDVDETDAMIAQIYNLNPEVAEGLQKLAQSYQFERIIKLTESIPGTLGMKI